MYGHMQDTCKCKDLPDAHINFWLYNGHNFSFKYVSDDFICQPIASLACSACVSLPEGSVAALNQTPNRKDSYQLVPDLHKCLKDFQCLTKAESP